ncbi:MAG: hypothetical protein ACLUOI_01940 [Eisenbergiella sp.]
MRRITFGGTYGQDEISGISREFEEVLEQVSAGIQPAEQVTGQPVPDEKLSGQQSFEKTQRPGPYRNRVPARVPGTAGGRTACFRPDKAWKQPQDKAVKELFYAQEPDSCQKEHNGKTGQPAEPPKKMNIGMTVKSTAAVTTSATTTAVTTAAITRRL